MNTPSADSIAKKTLMMRLFIHIYGMTDAKLRHLLTILDQEGTPATNRTHDTLSLMKGHQGDNLQRHAIIARLFVLIRQMDKDELLERLRASDDPEFHWSRAFPRMDCHLIVDFVVQGKAYRGYLRDISAGGIFMVTSDKFDIGQEVSLCFTLDESNAVVAFKLNGRIKHLYDNGIAVEYLDIPHDQQSVIDAMVHNRINV